MASQPRKDQIAEALVDVLRGVSKGADYRTDLGKNVGRYRFAVQELNQSKLPCASVWTANTEDVPGCIGSYRERVTFVVDVWVRAAKKEDVDAECLKAEADIRAAVLADTRLGLSFVQNTMPGKVQSDEQHYADQQVGYKAVGFLVDYNWTASAP